jgi:flagellar basal body-associated protein FliL
MDKREDTKDKKKVSKKGILLTALIVAGIVGASFLVYFIPQ